MSPLIRLLRRMANRLDRRPDRCTICGEPGLMRLSGWTRDPRGDTVALTACDEHSRRLDYALYLLAHGPDGDTLCRWLNERIDREVP